VLQFYPSSYITVAYSVIEASIAISQIIAAPVAAGLLQLSGVGGLAGGQHRMMAMTPPALTHAVALCVADVGPLKQQPAA